MKRLLKIIYALTFTLLLVFAALVIVNNFGPLSLGLKSGLQSLLSSVNSAVQSNFSGQSSGPAASANPSAAASGETPAPAQDFWGSTGMSGITVYEYGKSLLTTQERRSYYDQIAAAVLNVQSSVTISSSLDPPTMEMIYRDYFYDHPENFYLKNASLKYVYNQAGNTKEYESYTLLLSYSYDKNTVAGMRSRMGSALAGMLASAGGKSGDLAKERALHDALVGAVRYDTAAAANPASNPVSFTAYGALVNGSAVCDGYAKAMKLLLDSASMKSLYVSGTATNDGGSSPHAWDMAQVSGKWYYLDPTFDDPVFYNDKGQVVNKSAIYHTYFNFISNPDHTLGTFDAADPDSADSENYQQMPAAG